jgi:phosphatidylglycerophosphate synthase
MAAPSAAAAVAVADEFTVTYADVALYYPQLLDYFRIVLVAAATVTCSFDGNAWHISTAVLLLASFILDYYDGKVARYFNQCSLIGDGFDWTADICSSWVIVLWWGRLEPAMQPLIALWTMAETSTAIFDFALHTTERYPPRGKQTGFCTILEWAIPGGRWNWLGYLMWISYPFFCAARSLRLAGVGAASPAACLALDVTQVLLLVPSFFFVWSNCALLKANVSRWTERPRNKPVTTATAAVVTVNAAAGTHQRKQPKSVLPD